MVRLAALLLILLSAPLAAADLAMEPPAVLAAEGLAVEPPRLLAAADLAVGPPAALAAGGPLDCGIPHSLPINITCTQYAGEVCTFVNQTTCWAIRLACTYTQGPMVFASGDRLTCGQQPGCCESCQGANCTNQTRSFAGPPPGCANYGVHSEITAGDKNCDPGCVNHGIHVDVMVGDKNCGSGCHNFGIEIVVHLGSTACGDVCENTGISVGVGGSSCRPPVWVCVGSQCWWPDTAVIDMHPSLNLQTHPRLKASAAEAGHAET